MRAAIACPLAIAVGSAVTHVTKTMASAVTVGVASSVPVASRSVAFSRTGVLALVA